MALSPLQKEEEVVLVKEFIIIPVFLDVLERDIRTMSGAALKFPELYASHMRMIQKDVLKKQHTLKNELRSRGIKILDLTRTRISITAQYLCRGYEHEMALLWDLIKAEIELRLAEYLQVRLDGE